MLLGWLQVHPPAVHSSSYPIWQPWGQASSWCQSWAFCAGTRSLITRNNTSGFIICSGFRGKPPLYVWTSKPFQFNDICQRQDSCFLSKTSFRRASWCLQETGNKMKLFENRKKSSLLWRSLNLYSFTDDRCRVQIKCLLRWQTPEYLWDSYTKHVFNQQFANISTPNGNRSEQSDGKWMAHILTAWNTMLSLRWLLRFHFPRAAEQWSAQHSERRYIFGCLAHRAKQPKFTSRKHCLLKHFSCNCVIWGPDKFRKIKYNCFLTNVAATANKHPKLFACCNGRHSLETTPHVSMFSTSTDRAHKVPPVDWKGLLTSVRVWRKEYPT